MSATPPVRDATAPRYTTTADVKAILGITDGSKDARITNAIVAGESTIDLHMGRSMPDTDDAEGPQPPTLIIPPAWTTVAEQVAVAIYKAAEAPFGSAGSDDWLGAISVPDIVRSEVDRNPALVGWQISFGVR